MRLGTYCFVETTPAPIPTATAPQAEAAPRPDKSRGGLGRLFNALRYSMDGLGSSLKHESAFRQELILSAILVPIAIILPISLLGKALMLGSLLLVLLTELVNSAIEWTIDLVSRQTHPIAKRVKDMGSAAVFLALLHAFLMWGLVLADAWDNGLFQ